MTAERQNPQQSPLGSELPTPRAALVSFVIGILALVGSAACLIGVRWPQGIIVAIILLGAGVCGTMTAIQAWYIRSRIK